MLWTGGSSDGTVEFLQRYPNVSIIDDSNGNRATARQKGIEAVDTEWHLHVDSDVILCQNWFAKASKLLSDDVGAIWGVAIPIEPHTKHCIRHEQVIPYAIKRYAFKTNQK